MSLVPAVHTPCAVPADFDQNAYGLIGSTASVFADEPAWMSYASGFNGVAFRFAGADNAHEQFVSAASGPEAFSPAGPQLLQEQSLFAFFFNVCSSIECLYYAFYNLGACLAPDCFPATSSKDLRTIDMARTAECFERAYPGEAFTIQSKAVAQSSELNRLKTFRDVLTHRGTLPRSHCLGHVAPGGFVDLRAVKSVTVTSNPKDVPVNWVSDLVFSSSMTREPRKWMAATVNSLLQAGAILVATHARVT